MSLHSSLSAMLAHHVRTRPNDIAFIDGDRRLTYSDFDALCGKTAYWLARQGIGAGDTVAVWMVNRLEWLLMYFGLSHLGAALMTVNTRYRSHELEYILQHSGAKMLVLEPGFRKIDFLGILANVDSRLMEELDSVVLVDTGKTEFPETDLHRSARVFRVADLQDGSAPYSGSPDALNILFTTSGTTSGPKLVMHTQRNVAVHSQHVARANNFGAEGACTLAVLPFGGVFGFNAAFAAFAAGTPVVIMETFDAPEAARLINQHQITHVFGSDEMFRRIFEHGRGSTPFPSARVFGFASFHAGVDTLGRDAWQRGIPLIGLYGSSEVQALFSLQPRSLPEAEILKGGGVTANPDAEIRIRDIDSGELLPPGQSGAIEIRSDTNLVGYLGNEAATREAIDDDGFFRTGDVGYLREDGSFVYISRQGDAMRLAGYLVSPVEIEDVLKEQPGVADAQAVSAEIDGQTRCVAFVIPQPGQQLDEDTLKKGVGAILSGFKVPARIWFLNEFPTTQSANGVKIQRNRLRDMAMQKLETII